LSKCSQRFIDLIDVITPKTKITYSHNYIRLLKWTKGSIESKEIRFLRIVAIFDILKYFQ
jgi:hypothetical protein